MEIAEIPTSFKNVALPLAFLCKDRHNCKFPDFKTSTMKTCHWRFRHWLLGPLIISVMDFFYFIDEFVRASYLLGATDSYPKEEKKPK